MFRQPLSFCEFYLSYDCCIGGIYMVDFDSLSKSFRFYVAEYLAVGKRGEEPAIFVIGFSQGLFFLLEVQIFQNKGFFFLKGIFYDLFTGISDNGKTSVCAFAIGGTGNALFFNDVSEWRKIVGLRICSFDDWLSRGAGQGLHQKSRTT